MAVDDTPPTGLVIINEDFEAGLDTWQTSAVAVSTDDSNQALLLSNGSSLTPADALSLTDAQIDGQFNILTASDTSDADFSLTFWQGETSAYVVLFNASGTSLFANTAEGLTPLAQSDSAIAVNAWNSFSLSTMGNTVSLSVNDAEVIVV